MITSRAELKFYLTEDAKANGITSRLQYVVKLIYGNINAHSFRYLKSLRKYEYYHNNNSILKYWYRFYNRRLGIRYGLAMFINSVDYGLCLPHIEGGIILNCSHIGHNCTVNTNVLCGNKNGIDNDDIPSIGDNVTLCPGAKIIGKVKIGNNVMVAPNAVVVHDVPDNATVAGVPAQIISIR